MENFHIRFEHDGIKYTGEVSHTINDKDEIIYGVTLKPDGMPPFVVKVLSGNSALNQVDWDFADYSDDSLKDCNDMGIVRKIGSAIEKHLM